MIPRTMNFFWSGPRMTFMRYMTLYSFRKQNPDFPVVLWSPQSDCCNKTWDTSELDDSRYSGTNYLTKIPSLGIVQKTWEVSTPNVSHSQASDLFEWWLLSTAGGFYSDMDVLWVKPMSAIHPKYWHANSLCCMECRSTMFAIGFFGASPNNPMFRSIYDAAWHNYDPRKYESAGIAAVHRAVKGSPLDSQVIKSFKKRYPCLRIVCLPDNTVYFFDCRNYPDIFTGRKEVPRGCLGIHWFGGGPISQQWNRLLTPDNYQNYDNTFTRYCREVLNGETV